MRRIRFTRQARRDVDDVYDYIAADNPAAAQSVLDRIEAAIDRLPVHPEMGRAGRVAGTRELVLVDIPYIIAYEVSPKFIDVLAIMHTARQWPDRL